MYAFFITIAIGMLAGFMFDLYRVVGRLLKLKKWGTMLGDLLYWLILTPVVFVILLWGNWGEVRLYVIIGLSLGAVLYLQYPSKYIVPLIGKLIDGIKGLIKLVVKMLRFLCCAVGMPFRVLLLIVGVPLAWISKITGKIWRGIKRLINLTIGKLKLIFRSKD
ncbi:spore cortex biosynthesis protein YabQ [Desulfohalotomaculum tongense]|uniref:spore cortex biosynthesis protein YabQ n=1 Tax=Desulforadius tongensis TaxID=1216062 RepID=UPI0019599CA7|nr:spore cortex biosynthesis protein YabQ [Desulforadius tongensis]